MAVVKPEDFEIKRHGWAVNATTEEIAEAKKLFGEEVADPYPLSDAYDLHDDCFYCGQRITIPCVYWHGDYHKGRASTACFHAECVEGFAKAITRDAVEIFTRLKEDERSPK